MGYFQELLEETNKLDELASKYIQNRENKSLQELYEENTDLGIEWFKKENEDFERVPEIVALIADGHTPYGPDSFKINTSLNNILGFSLVSLEAHAWRLNDFLKGKCDSPDLPFELIAKVQDSKDSKDCIKTKRVKNE